MNRFVVVVVLAVVGVTASAAFAASPSVTPTVVAPGGSVKITGKISTCAKGSTVKLSSDAVPLGHKNIVVKTHLSSAHSYSAHVPVPGGVARGIYFIEVTCAGHNAPPGHFHVS